MAENEAEDTRAAEAGLDAEDPRFQQAVFGREVEIWLDNDPIADYIINRARADIESAKDELLTADPEDVKTVRALQTRAKVAESIRQWLGEAVQMGRDAVASLQQERDSSHAD